VKIAEQRYRLFCIDHHSDCAIELYCRYYR